MESLGYFQIFRLHRRDDLATYPDNFCQISLLQKLQQFKVLDPVKRTQYQKLIAHGFIFYAETVLAYRTRKFQYYAESYGQDWCYIEFS